MNESAFEQAALDWFRELGHEYIYDAHIAQDLPALARHGRQAVKPRSLPVRRTHAGAKTTAMLCLPGTSERCLDWQVRENAQAQIRVLVKRILRKHGYPPDMQQRATELVLE